MLTEQERSTLKVLLGKFTAMGEAFGDRELRVVLLLAMTWTAHSRSFSADAERLAAEFQQYLDRQLAGQTLYPEHLQPEPEVDEYVHASEWPKFLQDADAVPVPEQPVQVSHPDLISFSRMSIKQLGEVIRKAGGELTVKTVIEELEIEHPELFAKGDD